MRPRDARMGFGPDVPIREDVGPYAVAKSSVCIPEVCDNPTSV